MSDRALVFSAKDGLGNRLRALAGFRALARVQQVPLLLHWRRDGACDAEFTDLFETSGSEDLRLIDAAEAGVREVSHPTQFHRSSAWFTEIWREQAQSLCSREDFCRIAVAYLRALRPRSELQSRVDEFAKAHDLASAVGMHLRMTDNVHAYDWWSRNSPDFAPEKVSRIEGFRAAIRQLAAEGRRAYICTDNREVAAQLASDFQNLILYPKEFDYRGLAHHVRRQYGTSSRLSRFGDRVKTALGARAPTSWRTTNVGVALVELLLLARCQRVIGTYFSSFSQVGALIGAVPHYRVEGIEAVETPFIRDLFAIPVPRP